MTSHQGDSFDDLPILGELREALERRFAEKAVIRGFPPVLRYASVALAVAVAVAVAVVALTIGGHGRGAATSGGGGTKGGLPRQEIKYIQVAYRKAMESGACRAAPVAKIPAVSYGTPSKALLSVLSVLRRPASPSDRLPREFQGNLGAHGIYVRYIRRARTSDGISYYIVPAISPFPAVSVPPAKCYVAIRAAFRRELPQIPAHLRAPTDALLLALIVRERLVSTRRGEGICLLFAKGYSTGGMCGATTAEIEQEGLFDSVGRLAGVVPDGVATVTLRYPSQSATVSVVGNVFVTSLVAPRMVSPWPAMVWRSAQGKIIKVVPAGRPALGGGYAFCANSGSGRGVC